MSSLSRQYSTTSQRHLTVTAIRERLGWSDNNSRGYWQDLRDAAQEFRIRNFCNLRWGDIDEAEKVRLCRQFVSESRYQSRIETQEAQEGSPFISWWLLANTRPGPTANKSQPAPAAAPTPAATAAPAPRPYYDPVRG